MSIPCESTDVLDDVRADDFEIKRPLEASFQAALDRCCEAVFFIGRELRTIVYANQSAADWLQRSCSEVIGMPFDDLVESNVDLETLWGPVLETKVLFWRRLPKSESTRPAESTTAEATAFVQSIDDTLIVVIHHRGLPHSAETTLDPLTGLPDRATIVSRLDDSLNRSDVDARHLSVLFIDLDEFKEVNDRHGHLVGDKVLPTVAKRMAKCVRGDDLLGRYGGDEFVAVLPHVNSLEDADHVANRIRESVSASIIVDGTSIRLGVSAGAAVATEGLTTSAELIDAADRRMYADKRFRRGKRSNGLAEPFAD